MSRLKTLATRLQPQVNRIATAEPGSWRSDKATSTQRGYGYAWQQARLVHLNAHPLAWCCGNAKVEPRGNSILITKQASGSAKIDPLMATFNAVTLMALNPKTESSLSDHIMKHGIRTL